MRQMTICGVLKRLVCTTCGVCCESYGGFGMVASVLSSYNSERKARIWETDKSGQTNRAAMNSARKS